MNLFWRELKVHRKSLILWSIGVIFLIASGMSKYAVLSTTGESMNEVISQMPRSLQAIMGLGSLDLSQVSGYYGVLYVYLSLMAAIHASMLGATIISKEERDKTTEFLMVKPISRNEIITAKLLAAVLNIFLFNIVTFISSMMIVGRFSNGDSMTSDIVILMVGMIILQLIFLSIGTGIAAISKHPRKAPAMATTVLLTTYILSVVITMASQLDFLRFMVPFKYFEAKSLLLDGSLDPIYVVLSAVIITVMLTVTYVCYRKRDLNV